MSNAGGDPGFINHFIPRFTDHIRRAMFSEMTASSWAL